jgi:hypothetical protein
MAISCLATIINAHAFLDKGGIEMKKLIITFVYAGVLSINFFHFAPQEALCEGLEFNKTLAPDVTWCDTIEDARFGHSIAMGDINGDGFDDVLISAPDEHISSHVTGITRVYEGSVNGLKETPILQLETATTTAALADVNNDGLADIILGGDGCVYCFHGNAAWTDFYTPLVLDNSSANWSKCMGVATEFGYSVANAGDANGDKIDDIIASAPGENEAYIFYGSPSGLPSDEEPDAIVSESAGSQAGINYSITGFGIVAKSSEYDVTASIRVDNFLIGASTSSIDLNDDGIYSTNEENIGVALNGPRWWYLSGDTVSHANFGYALGNAGDVNGDGKSDIIISAKGVGTTQPKVFVYLGLAGSVLESEYDWAVEGIAGVTSSMFGAVVGSAGDINGDGYDEILVADPRHDGRPNLPPDHLGYWGRVYVWYGGPPTGQNPSGLGQSQTPLTADIIINADFSSGMYGGAFAAGDINGDGVGDVAIGDPRGAGWCLVPPDGSSQNLVETGFVKIYHSDFPPPIRKFAMPWIPLLLLDD